MTNKSSAEPAGTSAWAPPWTTRQVIVGTLVVLAVALCFWAVYAFRLVVFSLFVAIVLSTAISPIVDWVQRRGLSRPAAVALIYAGLLALLVGLVLLIGPAMVPQISAVGARLDEYYRAALDWLQSSSSRLVQRLVLQLLPAPSLVPPAEEASTGRLQTIVRLLAYVGLIGDGLFVFLAVLLLAYYWTIERERVLRTILLLVPQPQRDSLRDLFAESEAKVGAYIRGVATLCLIVGVSSTAYYWIIGLPSALLLGIFAGLFEALPLLGPVLGAAPAVLIALSLDPSRVLWVLVGLIVIQVVEAAVLVPRVMSRAVGVSPLVSLLALAGFGSLFGLAGAILAIPLAALIQLLVNRFVVEPGPGDQIPPAGRDRVSMLRFEAQDVVADVRKQLRNKSDHTDEVTDQLEDKLEAIAADLDSLLARWAQDELVKDAPAGGAP